MEAFLRDLRVAIRSLARRRGFSVLAILTVALGIGASMATFSVVDRVLLRPLPYSDPDGLIAIGSVQAGVFGALGRISHPEARALDDLGSLSAVAGVRNSEMAWTGGGAPELVSGTRVTRGILDLFGAPPVLGRDLTGDEAADENTRVIVLSYEIWRSHLAGTPQVVGQTLTMDGEAYEIVGIAPEGWAYPRDSAYWIPGGTLADDCWWGCNLYVGIARAASGVSIERIREDLAVLESRLVEESPATETGRSFSARSLLTDLTGQVSRGLWVSLASAGLLLLIASVNVANLMLLRGQSRSSELAVRRAIGARPRHVLRSIVLESAVIAVVGGALGVAMALFAGGVLPTISDGSIPRLEGLGFSPIAFGLVVALLVASTVVFGLLPGLGTLRNLDLNAQLRSAARSDLTHGIAGRSLLVATQVGLCMVVLVGAGLLLRTVGALNSLDPGFRTSDITRFDVTLPSVGYEEPQAIQSFVDRLEAGLRAIPGVSDASIAMGAPISSTSVGGGFRFLDRPEPPPGEGPNARLTVVTPSHFAVYGMSVRAGRGLERSDLHGQATAFVVNEAFVRTYFPDSTDPIGAPIETRVSFGFGRMPGEIVGVVSDVRTGALDKLPEPEIYLAHSQFLPTFFTASALTEGGALDPELAADALAAVDPRVPYSQYGTIQHVLRSETATTRFYLILLTVSGGLALALAAIGLYGIVAFATSQRTREIGLRVALGSGPARVGALIMSQGLRPALLGIGFGIAAALATSRVLGAILFGVAAIDLVTFAFVSILLLLVTLGATAIPALQAARIDPVEALRAD